LPMEMVKDVRDGSLSVLEGFDWRPFGREAYSLCDTSRQPWRQQTGHFLSFSDKTTSSSDFCNGSLC
jgi:hypothetical protein